MRRYLRHRSRTELSLLIGNRGATLATVAVLLAAGVTGVAQSNPPIELLDVAAGSGGFVINGIDPYDQSGWSVSGAGDVNGDGLGDLIVGAFRANVGGIISAEETYVVFGKRDGTAINLSDITAGIGGFVINGINPFDDTGFSVSGAGDVNGDGLADLVVGARFADPGGNSNAGESYVVFGKVGTSPVNLSDIIVGIGGFVINGIDIGDFSGSSVSGAGDVNGDGLADLIVGAPFADPGGHLEAGESYVVFGKADGAAVNLSTFVAGNGGFIISGIDPNDRSGRSISGAGDVNGDGLADLIVGAVFAAPGGNSNAGESYVIFGKLDGTEVSLSDVAAGIGGFIINGIDQNDYSGRSVSGAGDVNGDGLADLIVGAPSRLLSFPGRGKSYVVFGKPDGTTVNLASIAAGSGGFIINGINLFDHSGWSVSGAGDVSGDGLADLIVGAIYADPGGIDRAGESYVIFGKADSTAVNLDIIAAGSGGFVINGIDALDFSGRSVSGAGDVNGDGLADLIVGAPSADPFGNSSAGASYVIFSPFTPIPGDTNSDFTVDVTDLLAVVGAWGPCPAPCPPLCAEDTNNDCMVDITDLLTVLGHWTLNPMIGACCLIDGTCTILSTADCESAGGLHQGQNVTCLGVICPPLTGACCLVDGSCLDGLTKLLCSTVADTTFMGVFTQCATVTCPIPTPGACCVAGGFCVEVLETSCVGVGGVFLGEATSCKPNPCP